MAIEHGPTPPHNGINFGLSPEDQKEKVGAIGYVNYDGMFKFWDGTPQWLNFSPLCEIQKGYSDDYMDCTCEGKINAIHIFGNINGDDIKESVRYTAKKSGVTRQGNNIERVTSSVNSDGIVDEVLWPRYPSMSWDTYYANIPDSVSSAGKSWTDKYVLKTYTPPRIAKDLMNCLDYGILGATGYAWAKDSNGLYHDFGYEPNHYFIIVGYVEGQSWIVYDSYPTDFIIDSNSTKQEFEKHLSWDFNFGAMELLVVLPKDNATKPSKITQFKNMFSKMCAYMDQHGLNVFWVDKAGKQKIDITTMAEKALYMSAFADGDIKKTSWPALQPLPDNKYF